VGLWCRISLLHKGADMALMHSCVTHLKLTITAPSAATSTV
jgi:hypothetical protein